MKVINLFGGPGSGKSTTALELTSALKKRGIKAEYIPEYAKDLVYGEDRVGLSDQLHILGEQHHRQFRVSKDVDYCVCDGPFLLGVHYNSKHQTNRLPEPQFSNFVLEMFNNYDNMNYFIDRPERYEQYGRQQTESEAKQGDFEISDLLQGLGVDFKVVSCYDSVDKIMKDILN